MNLSFNRDLSSRPLNWRHGILALLFAGLSLFLTTRDNQFPASYHPDEPSKARQVLDRDYNFHHPLLLLGLTRALVAVAKVPPQEDAVTVAGRWASALFTAGAIFALALIAISVGGAGAGIFAGCLLVANHQLFELAHYFKEDPSCLIGVSAFFLALLAYDRRPGMAGAIFLGAALGLAVSGKYLGGMVAPLAFLLIGLHRTRPWRDALVCAATALGVAAAINLPILLQMREFTSGFEREIGFAVHGHQGIGRAVPHGVYWKIFLDSTMPVRWLPVVGLLLLAFYLDLFLRRKEVRPAVWMLALYPIAFAILLSFFPKTHHRYFLPATGLLLALAAVGAVTLLRVAWRGRPVLKPALLPVGGAVLLGVALAVQVPTLLDYYRGFSLDGRRDLAEYLRRNVPPGAVIVQDKRVDLDALDLPYEFRGRLFAAEAGPIEKLRAEGIRYIAVAEGDYGRYLVPTMKPNARIADTFREYRKFYLQLFAEGTRLFECPPGTVQYLQPHLILYELPPDR